MIKSRSLRCALLATGLGSLLSAGGAFATSDPHTYTFDFKNQSGHRLGNDRVSFYGENSAHEQKSVTVSAWRIENLAPNSGIHGDYSPNTNTEVSEYIYKWSSGIGVDQVDSSRSTAEVDQGPFTEYSSENAPWHAVDNNLTNCSAGSNTDGWCDNVGSIEASYTGEEFLVFDFGQSNGKDHKVNLHSFKWGYAREGNEYSGYSHQADSTVLAGNGVVALNDLYSNRVTEAGFDLVGHYSNVSQGQNKVVETDSYARYWAVSTLLLSEVVGGHFDPHLFDAGKLASIVVKVKKDTPVPVPATLILLVAGLLFSRRSKADQQGQVAVAA